MNPVGVAEAVVEPPALGQTAPFFIIGTERSGSNLLRLILDSHPRLMVPHPPHIVKYFTPLQPRYGDLTQDANFLRLVADILRLVDAHIHPWPWRPTVEDVVARSTERSVIGVYAAVHEALLAHVGKARWGCKSTFMVHAIPAVRRCYPNAKFLWLYRDPRDVAASARTSVFATFHPALTAKLWTDEQAAALAAKPNGNVLRVQYETLVNEPEASVRRICDFLGETFEPAMLRWFQREEASLSASLSESWKNTAAPMQRDRIGRYERDLSVQEQGWVIEIAGAMMATLGYANLGPASRQIGPDANPGPLLRARWWLADRWLWAGVELRSLRRDKNVWRRWSRSWLLWRIKARLVLFGP